MSVDEAGQQCGVTEIDDFGAGGLRGVGSDGLNLAAGDDDAGRDQTVRPAIELPARSTMTRSCANAMTPKTTPQVRIRMRANLTLPRRLARMHVCV